MESLTREVVERFLTALAAADTPAALDCCTEDVVFVPLDASTLRGRAAFERWREDNPGKGAQFGIVQGGMLPELRADLMDCYRNIDPFPEVPGVLARLKDKGMRLAILSNGSPDMLAAAATHAKLDTILEASLSVDAVKIYKPDRRVYQLACDHFGEAPARIAFFSSNGWDAHGAQHFGFPTAWLNRTGQPRENLPGAPAHECRTLADLPALLGL